MTGRLARPLAVAGLAVGIAGILGQYVFAQPLFRQMGLGWLTSLPAFLGFFTILTNLLMVAVYWAFLSRRDAAAARFLRRPGVRTATAAYISLVAVVYIAVLQGHVPLTPAMRASDIAVHYVAPVLYLAWWALTPGKAQSRHADVPYWLIWPVSYLAITMARGLASGWYPYPILDPNLLGWPAVAVNIAALIAFQALLGTLLVALAPRLGPQ